MFSILSAGSTAAFATMGENLSAGAELEERIETFAGGRTPARARISLKTLQSVYNAHAVPIAFKVESPMTDSAYVASVMLLADGNPHAGVATFYFSPLAARLRQAPASARSRHRTSLQLPK